MMYEMIYPEKRWVSANTLRKWAADHCSIENPGGAPVNPNTIPVDDAILILADSGTVTISTRTKE